MTTHEMVLAGHAESGAEEWHCPDCGRRMLLRWPPNYDKVVLAAGDERVTHVGGKGGVRMRAGLAPSADPEMPARERSWLRDNGIDWDARPA